MKKNPPTPPASVLNDIEFRADNVVNAIALVLESRVVPRSMRDGLEQVGREVFEIAEIARRAIAAHKEGTR